MAGWLQVALVVAGGIVTIDSAIRIVSTIGAKTVGRRRSALARLRRLATHVHVDYFNAVLGPPIFTRADDPNNVEQVWVDPYYFVQAFSNADGQVSIYSVTSRSPKFRPDVPFPNEGNYWGKASATPDVQAKLHVSTLASVGHTPVRIISDTGSRRAWYTEVYYFGNPSNYQSVALSVSDAAPSIGAWHCKARLDIEPATHKDYSSPTLTEFRREAIPNTYTISGPLVHLEQSEALNVFGADADDVRVFPR